MYTTIVLVKGYYECQGMETGFVCISTQNCCDVSSVKWKSFNYGSWMKSALTSAAVIIETIRPKSLIWQAQDKTVFHFSVMWNKHPYKTECTKCTASDVRFVNESITWWITATTYSRVNFWLRLPAYPLPARGAQSLHLLSHAHIRWNASQGRRRFRAVLRAPMDIMDIMSPSCPLSISSNLHFCRLHPRDWTAVHSVVKHIKHVVTMGYQG